MRLILCRLFVIYIHILLIDVFSFVDWTLHYINGIRIYFIYSSLCRLLGEIAEKLVQITCY